MRAIALLALVLCALASPGAAQTAALQDVRVGVVGSDQATALLYAQSAGLFRKAGINLVLTKASSGAAIASAVAGGALDIGQSQVVSLILAHARSVPFVMIAPTTYYSLEKRDSAIIVPAASPIHEPRDFAGKTIGVSSLNDIFTLSLKAWLKQNGIDPQSVHFLEVPPPTAPAALDAGRIDASVVFQPVMALSISSGKFRAVGYPLDAMGKRSEVAAYFTTTAWAAAHRDLIDAFAHVLFDASSYVADHERETAPILAQFSGVDVHVIETMTRPGRALYLQPNELQAYVDAAAQFHLIDKPFPVEEMISAEALRPPK